MLVIMGLGLLFYILFEGLGLRCMYLGFGALVKMPGSRVGCLGQRFCRESAGQDLPRNKFFRASQVLGFRL